MNPRKEAISLLEQDGFLFARHGAGHDIYFHPGKKITIPVKRHDFDEDDMRYILKEARIKRPAGQRKGK